MEPRSAGIVRSAVIAGILRDRIWRLACWLCFSSYCSRRTWPSQSMVLFTRRVLWHRRFCGCLSKPRIVSCEDIEQTIGTVTGRLICRCLSTSAKSADGRSSLSREVPDRVATYVHTVEAKISRSSSPLSRRVAAIRAVTAAVPVQRERVRWVRKESS